MPSHIKIRDRRQELHLSLTALAALIQSDLPHVSRTVLSKIEHGKRSVLADELPVFARALKCKPSDLVDDIQK